MRLLTRLLTLTICLEMILAPLSGGTGLISIAEAADTPDSCAAKGMVYNGAQGRCNVKASVTKTENQVDHCRSITDENARKNCYQRNVDDGKQNIGEDGYKDSFKDQVGGGINASSAAAISLPLFFLIKQLSDKTSFKDCKPASLMLLYSGGGALALGEIVSYVQHRINLGKLEKAYKEWNVKEESENVDDNKVKGMNSQAEAFELLAKNQDSIKSVATTKAITYGVATGVFAAGAVMGGIETFQLKKAIKDSADPEKAIAARATIERLTCKKDDRGQNEANAAEAANAKKAEEQTQKENIAKENDGILDPDGTTVKDKDGLSLGKIITTASGLKEFIPTKKESSSPPDSSQETGTENPATMDKDRCERSHGGSWEDSQCYCYAPNGTKYIISTGICNQDSASNSYKEIEDLLNLKIKRQATKNIAHAKNFEEIIELIEEINAIEYENYSSFSYNDQATKEIMRKMDFDKAMAQLISDALLASANADNRMGLNPTKNFTDADPESTNKPELQVGLEGPESAVTQGNPPNFISKAKTTVKDILNKAIYTPLGRASLNTLLGTWMGIMTANMMKNVKDAKERAAYLRSIKSDFETTGGLTACTSSDRNNPNKPICYCYTSDNSFNPARANSQVCANRYVGINKYPNAADGAYDQKACLNQNYEVDSACACKRNNSCVKVSQISGMGLDPGTFRMLGSMVAPANALTNGQASIASINSASIGNNAAKVKKKADELMKKIPEAAKATKSLEGALLGSTSGLRASPSYGSGGSSLSNFNPSQAAAELKKEIEENKDTEVRTSGNMAGGGGSNNSATEDLEFGLTEDMLHSQETEIAEIMNKDLDMGSNDINTNSTNIFEVLSNRYKRSGMRRLFDDTNSAPLDKPANTDITE